MELDDLTQGAVAGFRRLAVAERLEIVEHKLAYIADFALCTIEQTKAAALLGMVQYGPVPTDERLVSALALAGVPERPVLAHRST